MKSSNLIWSTTTSTTKTRRLFLYCQSTFLYPMSHSIRSDRLWMIEKASNWVSTLIKACNCLYKVDYNNKWKFYPSSTWPSFSQNTLDLWKQVEDYSQKVASRQNIFWHLSQGFFSNYQLDQCFSTCWVNNGISCLFCQKTFQKWWVKY